MSQKICSKCKVSKPLPEFYIDKRYRSGLSSQCKECAKLRSKEQYKNLAPVKKKRKVETTRIYNKNLTREEKDLNKKASC